MPDDNRWITGPATYGQSKSMDKRLAEQGKPCDAREVCIMVEFRFNELIDKRLEGPAARDAKRALRNATRQVEDLFNLTRPDDPVDA